jgi:hypothetical protein
MKKVLGFLVFLLVFSVTEMTAQYKNKAALASDLNNTSGLTLDAKQKKDYDNLNNKMLADLEKNDKSNKSKGDRDKEIDRIFDQNGKDMDKMFGNNDDYKKNNKSFKQHRRSIKMKMKLAKLAL